MTYGQQRIGAAVLGSHVDAVGWKQCIDRIIEWASRGESRSVYLCNVHSLVSARREPRFARIVNSADLVTPDGAPIAWCLRLKGYRRQPRISGAELMWGCCRRAEAAGLPVYLYGGSTTALDRLTRRLSADFPQLRLAGCCSPPYRDLTAAEDAQVVRMIRASGARILFVALGCPKQEAWIAAHRGRIDAVMIGVGAAFDFQAGLVRRAPRWMQRAGLEWLHRLLSEPKRLWRRYLVTNSLFVAYLLTDLVWGRLQRSFR